MRAMLDRWTRDQDAPSSTRDVSVFGADSTSAYSTSDSKHRAAFVSANAHKRPDETNTYRFYTLTTSRRRCELMRRGAARGQFGAASAREVTDSGVGFQVVVVRGASVQLVALLGIETIREARDVTFEVGAA